VGLCLCVGFFKDYLSILNEEFTGIRNYVAMAYLRFNSSILMRDTREATTNAVRIVDRGKETHLFPRKYDRTRK